MVLLVCLPVVLVVAPKASEKMVSSFLPLAGSRLGKVDRFWGLGCNRICSNQASLHPGLGGTARADRKIRGVPDIRRLAQVDLSH